jgi:hypothetical protein
MKISLALTAALLMVFENQASGQWIRTNGPAGGYIHALAASGGTIVAGTKGSGVFLSTDNSTDWTQLGLKAADVQSFAVSGGKIFAGTNRGVFISAAAGAPWTAANSGLTNTDIPILFCLPHSDLVAVAIYNLSGAEIASLVKSRLGQGTHIYHWNAQNVARGCYLAKIRVGKDQFAKNIRLMR